MLLIENESHQTALAMVEEEDQFADCLELVSVTSLFVTFLHLYVTDLMKPLVIVEGCTEEEDAHL